MEFRKMRRFKQELDHETCVEIINRATSGVLSVLGDVPNKLYAFALFNRIIVL